MTLGQDNSSLAITLIAKPVFEASKAIDSILKSWGALERMRREETVAAMNLAELEPVPGGAHLFKLLLFSPITNPDSSVLVTNLVDGWRSLVHVLAKSLMCVEIQLLSTEAGATYPRNSFEFWQDGVSKRVVQVLRDSDRWCFFEKGEPETFEQVDRYKARIIKARLTRELLLQYAAALGWNIGDTKFAVPNGKYLTYTEERKE